MKDIEMIILEDKSFNCSPNERRRRKKETNDWKMKYKQVELNWFDYLSIYEMKGCKKRNNWRTSIERW